MPAHQTKAILVDVIDPKTSRLEAVKRLEELESLINTYGGIAVVKVFQKKSIPDYATYVGKGKVDEIVEIARREGADILVVNNLLKPRQIFNLDEILRKAKLHTKTWDRVDLILKIFDKHAVSSEAKLQIELASIRHMGPRIFGMGMELSQQTGAVGVRGGAGEANIEIMKRHLRRQELAILKKLEHYDTIQQGHRLRRRRQNFKTVALVGYTNAGKSSLLKALTGKDVYIADKLFATLDTRIGQIYIPNENLSDGSPKYIPGRQILISYTIGFIQDLPPDLIQAFKSTLAETIEADIIIHVIDVADEQIHKKIGIVEEILDQLGLHDRPKIYVFNKIDMLGGKLLFMRRRPRGKRTLLKAGAETAMILGWFNESKRESALELIKSLKKDYGKFDPIFVSAMEKIRLDEVIAKINSLSL
ncbi:GTPase HflX [Candidatus Peregrinibacteria bacterium]|nr:GTPase HflX [Candidatus Peregrinibacteria bacterium]